jgi:hypothetical protein
MLERDDDLSPTLAETARRRADLRDALVQVEQASSRPAVGREPEWTKEVLLRLEGLAHEISAKAPHLATKIDALREEHPVLRERAKALITRLQTTPVGPAWPLHEARDDLQRLLGQLVRHRQLGSDLVWEAYNLDIGGIE